MSEFKPMLASPADFTILKYPVYASPKLDGIRCVNRGRKPLTRKLLDVPNKHTRLALSGRPRFDGLDGEFILGEPTDHDVYLRTNSAVMRHEGNPSLTLYVFDIITDETLSLPFSQRFSMAQTAVEEARETTSFDVRMHEHLLVANEMELLAYEAQCIADGYEGLILRAPDGLYKYGRSTAREQGMLKVKRFEDSEAVVLGTVEEQHNTNTAERDELGRTKRSKVKAGLVGKGTMGALSVRDLKTGVEFEIGTGFTAADRARTDWFGKIVKYKFFPIGVKDKPRHPVYLGDRDSRDMS